jgi:hypothetical protein
MDSRVHRVLAVADWSVDPEVVAEALAAHDRRQAAVFGLLVPARLAALDWIGDPKAACPCASEQLERLRTLIRVRGVEVEPAVVGGPEQVPAVEDALTDWPAEELVVFERKRRVGLSHPLSAARRLERRTGLPVRRIVVESRDRRRRGPRCVPRPAQAA